jgi:inward rectifier potassium channel
LTLRVGNARGNEIVEASMRVVALIDEKSVEGRTMRRLHDLELVRSTSPLFVLTWQVMHVIDESSPLYGIRPENLKEQLALFVVTLTGHDATYGQTIHGRIMYYPENVYFDHHFVDVLSTLPDGRFLVDYDKFHEVEPEPPATDDADLA